MVDNIDRRWVARATEMGSLGLMPLGLPPGRIKVLEIQVGGWAESQGICVGDEIIRLSGANLLVAQMTEDMFIELMQQRPLELTLVRTKIVEGDVLLCIGNDDQDYAEIYESTASSMIVGNVQRGSVVTVDGPLEDVDGYVMVPIQPAGAVQLDLFQRHVAENTEEDFAVEHEADPASVSLPKMARGDVLICIGNHEQDYAEIYKSMMSFEIIGNVQCGSKVVVAGEPEDIHGFLMVPIESGGAVQFDLFDFVSRQLQDEVAQSSFEEVEEQKPLAFQEAPKVKTRFPPAGRAGRKGVPLTREEEGREVSLAASSEINLASEPADMLIRRESFVDLGTCLRCIIEGQQPVCVFRDTRSPAVIAVLRRGDEVIAAGRTVKHGSILLVPVRPVGAVELAHFSVVPLPRQELYPQVSPRIIGMAKLVRVNSLLICCPPANEELADVFDSCHSHTVVDIVQRGCYVVTKGLVIEKWGCLMVPIRPRGAVDFTYFRLKSNDALANVSGNTEKGIALATSSPFSTSAFFPPPSPRDGGRLDGPLATSKIALTVAVFAGLDVRAICATCGSIRDAVCRVWEVANETSSECLYICGGSGNGLQMLNSVERFNLHSNSFEQAPKMLKQRIAPAGVVLGKRLYVCGGCTQDSPAERGVEFFDFVTERWTEAPPMHVARVGAAAAALGSMLCVCGGRDGLMRLANSMEWLSMDATTWNVGPPMLEHRLNPCAGAFGNRLYLCGGSDQFGQTLRSAECFTAGDSSWQVAPHMREHRRGAAAACATVGPLIGRMYVCGGWCGTAALSSTECFVASLDIWEEVAPMSRPRSYACAAITGQRIYVFGGYCEGECLNTIDRFDVVSGQWNSRGVKPMLERRAYAVASQVF